MGEAAEDFNQSEYYNDIDCEYKGTDHPHIKIYLIGVFGTAIALLNVLFNTFYTIVFVTNKSLRRSPLYYFGILAILDILLAINYIMLMSVPVYMDQFNWLWLYHIFLRYLNPMMTASNSAMFASMLLIFMATVERLLRTFRSEKLAVFRKLLERCRPQVCFVCICVAVLYKLCTHFEIHYIRNENCTDWAEYEITATSLVADSYFYRFWWMFVARNLIDRIIPFFLLVLINFLIIRALKREHQRFTVVESRLMSVSDVNNKKILRDATRALSAVVSLYLISQTLQVFTTFWEAFDKNSLEDHPDFYSYLNDVMSLMTLLSSTLRFPVYCACNNEIYEASKCTYQYLKATFFSAKTGEDYLPIAVNHGPKDFKPLPIVEVPPPSGTIVATTDGSQDSQDGFL
uniref:G_PROTEIN_RECEP_F1_2 domain-containing protein n=1 Tax=Panagrellus redivivus TaxID=6233 RepID=A0A7E4ZQ52_PANRE